MLARTVSCPIFIIGCGDIGRRVAAVWLQRGTTVTAVQRRTSQTTISSHKGPHKNPNKSSHNSPKSVVNLALDFDDPQSVAALNINNAIVYYFVPPPKNGVIDSRISHFLSKVQTQTPKRLVYISTSGVYGDCNGRWITEDEPPKPTSDRSHRRLNAENQLQSYCRNVGADFVVLRVSGIYGVNRLPVERIKQSRPIVKDHASFTNRIHEDDLARICVAAGEIDRPAGIFNVSDGMPGTMAQYFTETAKALNLQLPPEISWQEAQKVISPEMLSYLSESRRIDNKKMLQQLGVELLYPDLATGLKACGDHCYDKKSN